MRVLIRMLIRVLVLWLIISMERAVGTPVVFLVLTAEWATGLETVVRMMWLLYAAVLCAALFAIPMPVAFLLVTSISAWLTWGQVMMRSKTVRLLVVAVTGGIVTHVLTRTAISFSGLLYISLVLVVIVTVIKQDRLSTFSSWRKR